jgi:ABC-2 type transport system ATP-binding protein
MLKLDHVYKRFGANLAVEDLSFELKAGEIVGLLGPNGAGKTTTMRLITSLFFPDVGRIFHDGHDTAKETLLTQAKIGYLPENNPLYPEMLVIDFLLLTWGLNPQPTLLSAPTSSTSSTSSTRPSPLPHLYQVAASVNLEHKLMRPISELSKGYRQRVGLAAALLTAPQVLILDEPTEGLDPNERQEIRDLIKKLAKDRVILISTHVLQEVKAICTKAIVINEGRLVVAGHPDHLTNRFSITAEIEGTKLETELKKLINTKTKDELEISSQKAKIKTVTLTTAKDVRPALTKLAAKNHWIIWSVTAADELDQIFRSLKE